MKSSIIIAILSALPALCQQTGPAPIFQVTVIERTTKAVNYQYRSGPTPIDFRGTVLLGKAKGDAIVESKQGRTEINARFEGMTSPQAFGREYLTYVLWALTPEGRPHNLGEIVPGSSDKAKLRVTTDLQAFALIVTAEPYSAVRSPGDVVVLENMVRPDTIGKIEEVNAKYELLPRGHYAWNQPSEPAPAGPSVSTRRYEELSELYQAQNAVGIAGAAGAAQYAPNTFAKAEQLLTEAQQLDRSKSDTSRVVQAAREASQTAEDARVMALRVQQDQQIAKAQVDVNAAQQARIQAERDADEARNHALAAEAQAEAERAARQQTEREAAAVRVEAQTQVQQAQIRQAQIDQAQSELSQPRLREPLPAAPQKTETRMRLLEQLNGALDTRDTPRGLVVTLTGAEFTGTALQPAASNRLARIGAMVAAHPGLRVEVEGHTDTAGTEPISWKRAEAVRNVLIAHGLFASAVTSRGLGNSRPISSVASQNQRVEIVISGDPIGSLPFWDRTYSLTHR
jgi:outer membrane protein OmpA-like peptidoglycan-associated protein